MAYQFTDKDNMVGKKPRQIYWTELQDAANENADKIGNLSTMPTTEKTNLAGAVGEVKNELVAHKADEMPHQIINHKTGKTYRYGYRISSQGKPQIISEEAIQ